MCMDVISTSCESVNVHHVSCCKLGNTCSILCMSEMWASEWKYTWVYFLYEEYLYFVEDVHMYVGEHPWEHVPDYESANVHVKVNVWEHLSLYIPGTCVTVFSCDWVILCKFAWGDFTIVWLVMSMYFYTSMSMSMRQWWCVSICIKVNVCEDMCMWMYMSVSHTWIICPACSFEWVNSKHVNVSDWM